jgi:hypothetical protein
MPKVPFSKELDLEIYRQAGDFIGKVTCQIFLDGGKLGYTPLGTGILANIGSSFYIFTASHVAEEYDKKFYILTPKGIFLEVFGDCQYTNHSEEPKIDVAFIIIDKSFASILGKEFKFLTEKNILVSHSLINASNYSAFGYPAKNTKLKKKEEYISTKASMYVLKPSATNVYKYHNFDENLFYALEFKGRGIDLETGNKSQKLGKQNGLSGGGLWFMSVTAQENEQFDIDFQLIGIMTDEPVGKFKCLVGNKINVLISYIAEYDKNKVAAELISQDVTELYIHEKKE